MREISILNRTDSGWPPEPCSSWPAGRRSSSWSESSPWRKKAPGTESSGRSWSTQLLEDPPESGLPALQVIERAARDILPVAARIDHPPFLRVHPVFAHLAGRGGRLHGRRVSRQPMHLADLERSQPARVGGPGIVPPLGRLSRQCGRAPDQRGLGGQPGRLRRGTRSGRTPQLHHGLHGRPESQRADPGGQDHRHPV